MCLALLNSGACVHGFALHTRGFLPDVPENTRLTSSLQAVAMPGEAVLFFSHAGALGWTDNFGIVARDF